LTLYLSSINTESPQTFERLSGKFMEEATVGNSTSSNTKPYHLLSVLLLEVFGY